MNKNRKKLVVYGLGTNFKMYFTRFVFHRLQQEFYIIGFVDKNIDLTQSIFDGLDCYHDIPDTEYDFVCITSTLYFDEIKKELLAESVAEYKILAPDFWFKFCRSNYLPIDIIQGKGLEIGGPSDVFQAVYDSGSICDGVNYDTETVWGDNSSPLYKWKGKVVGLQMIADATDLKMIKNETYDFILSSNNLEHIANPMKAISEFLRILKRGRPIVILVPCKQYTFDHRREDTAFEHILEDYKAEVLEDDLTHLGEILEKHDLSLDRCAGTMEQFIERCENNFHNRCLHHHVFSSELLKNIAEYFRLEIIENTVFDYNYLLVAIKKKEDVKNLSGNI